MHLGASGKEAPLSSVRVHCLSVSLDGYATGEGQRLDAPFGHAGSRLLEWFAATRTFRQIHGEAGGTTNADDVFASRWEPGIGADIMGRNMFGPERGPWEDPNWKGWWGDNPPYHNPVFVLTHYPRPSIEMEGGTTFHFIDASPADALAIAREAAGELDVRIGGGPSDYPPVPRGRPHRPPARRDRSDRPRTRRAIVGRAGGARRALRHRVGDHPERRDPPRLQPPGLNERGRGPTRSGDICRVVRRSSPRPLHASVGPRRAASGCLDRRARRIGEDDPS